MSEKQQISSLSGVRARLTNTVVWTAACFALLTLFSSLIRIPSIGFLPVMGLHIGATLYLIFLYVFRQNFSSKIKALSVCVVFFLVGIAGVLTLGLASNGVYLIIAACFYSSFILKIRVAVGFAISGAAAILLTMVLVNFNLIQFSVAQSVYTTSMASWITMLVVYSYVVCLGLFLNYHFFRYVQGLIDKQHNQILTQHSQIQHSEAVLQNVINHLPYGILWKDKKGVFLGANQVFIDDLECKNIDSIVGKTDFDVMAKASAKQFLAMDRQIISGKVHQLEFEEQMLPDTGETIYRSVNRLPMLDQQGNVMGVLVSYHDITDLRNLEQKAQEALAEAERASQAKSQFLANMSHEIRTPINGILGLLDLCLSTELTEQQRQYLSKANFSAQLLLDIINDVLDLSKIEAGQLVLESRTFHFESLIEHIEQMFVDDAGKKQLELITQFSGQHDVSVIGDSTRIIQIMMNLVSNAVKFTHQGSVSLKACLVANKEQAKVRVTVADTGIGIPAEVLPRLFNNFTQADETITRKFGGTGLGLSIVKLLVERMGGTLQVESKEQQGSEFTFTLTLPVANILVESAETLPSDGSVENVKVLLVEDNLINLEVASSMLSEAGAKVTTAENGKVALEKLQKKSFDVVLMDVQMPVMDGCSALKSIRNNMRWRKLPVVALTANVLAEEVSYYKTIGFTAHLGKPFERQSLINVVANCTRKT